jgi:hypoxanthine phosphoribosyltransferase
VVKLEKFKCETPTWQQIHDLAYKTAEKIKKSGYVPDVIIGIARGGLVPSRLIADFLHVKELVTIKADHWGITATKDGKARISYGLNMNLTGKRVLLVDDITDTGQSIELSKRHVREKNPADVKTATLYHLINSEYVPDFFGLEREWAWMIFPWNHREDMVNITRKIMNKGKKELEQIKKELHTNFNLKAELDDIKEILAHIDYLETIGR